MDCHNDRHLLKNDCKSGKKFCLKRVILEVSGNLVKP